MAREVWERWGGRFAARRGTAIGLLLAAALSVSPPAGAIIDGQTVRPDEPALDWTVLVENADGRVCSGALLAPDRVLTAAHCTLGQGRLTVRRAGDQGFEGRIPVVEVVRHGSFQPALAPRQQPGADLALMQLGRWIAPQVETLEPEPNELAVGAAVTAFGFGEADEGARAGARVLRRAVLEHVGLYRHASGARAQFAQDPLTKAKSPGRGACGGDSGGPVIVGRQGAANLVGIISWSTGVGPDQRCGGYTAFVAVAEHVDWIQATQRALAARHNAAAPQTFR
jgi:secreted trypsin-like serine protease